MFRKGLVLMTVVVVSLIALAFTGALLYLITSETGISSAEKRYTNALEVGKGVSSYIMQLATRGDLCSMVDCTKIGEEISEKEGFKFKTIGNYEVEAYLLRKVPPTTSPEGIYSIKVVVKNIHNKNERSEIYFVYEVSSP
jgi:hypothetical protein